MQNKRIYLILGLLLLIVVLFAAKFIVDSKVSLLSITPQPNQEDVSLLPQINLVFNREVNPQNIKFVAEPNFEYKVSALEDKKTIRIEVTKFLEKDAVYKITLEKPTSFTWQFKTRATQAGSAPGWEEGFLNQEKIYKEQHPQEEVINKLKSLLPYRAINFSVEYAAKTDQFFIYLNKPPISESQKEALLWIQDQGVNPKLLNIVWFPVEDAVPPHSI